MECERIRIGEELTKDKLFALRVFLFFFNFIFLCKKNVKKFKYLFLNSRKMPLTNHRIHYNTQTSYNHVSYFLDTNGCSYFNRDFLFVTHRRRMSRLLGPNPSLIRIMVTLGRHLGLLICLSDLRGDPYDQYVVK